MQKIFRFKFIDQIVQDSLLRHSIITLFFGAVFGISTLFLNPFSEAIEIFLFILIVSVGFIVASYLSFRIVKITEKEHLLETDKIFMITNKTVSHLRHGLTTESAVEVAKILAEVTDTTIVSITDRKTVIACEGNVNDSFLACSSSIEEKAKKAMKDDVVEIIDKMDELYCQRKDCQIHAAIIVPLHLKKNVVGSIKFYYENEKDLTNERIAFAKGIASLLSNQLELSEIDYQTTLAFKAQLKALQAQINPHFLFNTLNTIAMFCRTKPTEARRLLLEFSAFFRKSLERTEDFITLKDELEYVKQYLIFEKARFGEGIDISMSIDPETIGTKMPALTLQPIVENAIRHGFPTESKPLHVQINSSFDHDNVLLTIKDNGSGIKKTDLDKIFVPGFGRGLGLGLSNVNDRLRGLYGSDYKISVTSQPGKGTSITIQLPLNGGKVSAA